MARFDILIVDLKIDSGGGGIETRENRGAAGTANRSLAMGVCKCHSSRGEPVDVWRFSVGVSIEAAYPIIQVVDRDE